MYKRQVCESASALLNELGMRGYWVLTGQEAGCCIVKAQETGDDFFAVILDWKMPGMDGLETVRVITVSYTHLSFWQFWA